MANLEIPHCFHADELLKGEKCDQNLHIQFISYYECTMHPGHAGVASASRGNPQADGNLTVEATIVFTAVILTVSSPVHFETVRVSAVVR